MARKLFLQGGLTLLLIALAVVPAGAQEKFLDPSLFLDGELAGVGAHRLSPRVAALVVDTAGSRAGTPDKSAQPEMSALRDKIRSVLALYYPKHQNTRDNTNWEVMHEIIAYGVESQLFRGGPQGPKVNAVGWLCYNGPCHGETMLYLDRGQLVARKGVGLQGHFGQFLAILAQSHVKTDYPLLVGGKSFTIADLVEHEKLDCQAGEELTFKLIGLMHYLDSDSTWRSRDGQTWSIQRLISEELKQPIRGAACGGTHRLMGFSYAVNKRIKREQPVVGQFRRAQIFINDYHRYTFALQNPDGTFSTQWFTRREADPSLDRRLKTTGHILEWLTFSLSNEELSDPRVVKAVDYLATILQDGKDRTWEIGPIGHGLHGLAMYDARMFGTHSAATTPVATSSHVVERAQRSLLPPFGQSDCQFDEGADVLDSDPDAKPRPSRPSGKADAEPCL